MKRLISILVITAMLLASVMAMIPAFADEIETPKAPTEGTYNVDWKALVDAGKMAASDNNKVIENFASMYTPVADANSLTLTKVAGSGSDGATYYSTDMFVLSETTYYEYVVTAKNSSATAYGGIVFAYDTEGYPYMIIGSTDNESDDGEISEFRVQKGKNGNYAPGIPDRGFLKLAITDGFGTIKVVYDGYNVSVYGLTDAANGTYELVPNTTFTLPEGSKIALGTFARAHRTNVIKDAALTAKGRESAAILAGASETKIALAAALDAAYDVILTDYTDETSGVLASAIETAELAFAAETEVEADVTAATTAINAAIAALVAEKADLTRLVMYYSMLKYRDNAMYNQDEVAALLAEAEAAMENKSILQSEVDALVGKMGMISELAPIYSAADFANMDPNGSYILMEDIEITAAYGEFKGYLNGNGKTITVKDCGVFGTLNGATVFDFTIDGSITGTSHVGALATDAKGNIAITNVINNATINVNKGGQNVGGFIGQGKGTNITFTNCVNNADIIGGRTSGFYATTVSGEINLYFYNCINKGNISCGEGVSTNPAAGFVARTASDGTTKNIVFEYCANYGDINSKYSAGAFFGCGKATDIKLYGCVVTDTTVTAADNQGHMRPVGGVIGGSTGDDGVVNVDIDACYFQVDVNVIKNKKNNPVAAIVGGVTGSVSIKNVIVTGSVTTVDEYAYRLTSVAADRLTVENVLVDVELNIPEIPDTSKDPISGTGEGETPVYPNKEPADTTPNTDMEAFDEDSTVIAAKGIIAMQAAAMEMNVENKIEATEEYVAGLAALKTKAEVVLDAAKADVLATLEAAKDAALYTEESYAEYKAAYDAIVETINGAADAEALAAIDVAALKTAAEAKLVTLEAKAEADAKAEAEAEAAAKAKELADAKATYLIALSAKRENAGKVFTDASYTEYSAAFDAIKAQIEGAADMAALQAIDVAALKVAAENKLAVNVPAAPEAPDADNKDDDNKNDETDKATEENKDDETEAPKADKGCGSTPIIIIAIVVVICGGVALFVMQKKKEN